MNASRALPRYPSEALRASAMVLLGLFSSLSSAAEEAQTAPDAKGAPVAAVWKEQEIGFHFQSFTTFYTCQALEGRIEQILVAVGADPKALRVRSTGCEGGRIARLPFVRIKITSPVEATPEVLAQLKSTRSTRELAARVKGERAPEADERFDAYWKPVSLFRGRLRLDPGDCQLVEQLQREVFPKLGVRVTKDGVNCMPNQVSMTTPRLELEALVPVQQVEKKNPTPAPATKD